MCKRKCKMTTTWSITGTTVIYWYFNFLSFIICLFIFCLFQLIILFYFICFFISLRNKTKLHVNLTHDFNSSSAAIQVTLLIEVSFKGELSSFIVTPESKNPDVLQGSNIEVMLFLGKSVIFTTYNVILLALLSMQCC